MYDAIVIGSGMGGLGCAAALARFGRRVAVFEQHTAAGGLTHTFQRDGYTWDVGVHYLGQMGPGEPMRRVLDWLSGNSIDFAALGAVYDVVRLADGTRFEYARPRAALEAGLREAFPGAHDDIARYLAALDAARSSFATPFQQHAMPGWLAHAAGWLKAPGLKRWWGRTVAEVLGECTRNPRLAAVLGAQWGDHGGTPSKASFAVHAIITDHYLAGAWYPVGGAGAFARGLVPVIEAAGGAVRTAAPVARVLLQDGRATGVELKDGSRHQAGVVISSVGAQGTVAHLLPPEVAASPWGREVSALEPSLCHVCLYVGLEGDVEAAGATRANHWIYDSPDLEALWDDPFSQARAPALFVSFPSLKDPARPAGTRHHTAEVVAWADWSTFEPWSGTRWGQRPEDYRALRNSLEHSLRAQFEHHFPGLAPMIRLCELSTPLSTVHFTGHARGAVYGLNTTPARFASRALDIRTPVPGLLLTGQDVVMPGVTGALMGGILSAAVVEPRVFAKLPR
jgi:all-trans-retinol 13,14-reductase